MSGYFCSKCHGNIRPGLNSPGLILSCEIIGSCWGCATGGVWSACYELEMMALASKGVDTISNVFLYTFLLGRQQ